MAKQSTSHKRLKLFIDRDVQGTLARRFLFHWCSLAFCMFIMTAVVHVLSSPLQSPELQFDSYLQKHGQVFFVLLMLTPAFLWDSIKFSNRFAGPVLRLRRAMEDLGKGESVQPLKFRDNDFWEDLAVNFNQVRERVIKAEDAKDAALKEVAKAKSEESVSC